MASTSGSVVFGQCRCCLKDGYHKNIMREYDRNGVREVYFDMILDCFNLFLSTNSSLTNLICKSCIEQLQQASDFRHMVAKSEQTLLNKTGEKDSLFINFPEPKLDVAAIKLEEQDVKLEIEFNDQTSPYDDDTEHADDALAPEAPASSDDLVDGEAALLARWAATVRPLPTRDTLYQYSPRFVTHLDRLRGKVVSSKMIEKLLEEAEFQADYISSTNQSRQEYRSEKSAQITNALALLENSNLTPFKSRNRTGYPCFYCRRMFENLSKIKEHQTKSHKKSELMKILPTYGPESLVIYVDVTDLKCTVCNLKMSNINNLKSHLIKIHNKKYYQDLTDRVIPFKLSETNVFECQICGFNFETFGSIERHMNSHYRNYICKDCGSGFVTKYRLKVHVKSMHTGGNFPCETCKKVFTSPQKLKNHTDAVHKQLKRFKCVKCPERFTEYFKRQKHMVVTHGVAPLHYKCNVCDKSFERRYTLSRHMKRDHLEERDFQCDVCTYRCFTNAELQHHMIKHNGERIFECAVCKKSYARKKTLREHMRIHNNDRRFVCGVCGQAFVQKCSLKGHMKTHHIELSLSS